MYFMSAQSSKQYHTAVMCTVCCSTAVCGWGAIVDVDTSSYKDTSKTLRIGQELLLRNQHHWLKNVHIRGCADGHNGGYQLISFNPFHYINYWEWQQ